MFIRLIQLALVALVALQAQHAPSRIDYLHEGKLIRALANPENFDEEGAVVGIAEPAMGLAGIGHRDGHWVLTLRVSSPGARGLQFLFEDVRIGAGSKLLVWELDSLGAPASIRGSYEGAGPIGTGQFWSAAVAGEESLIELVLGADDSGDLPFRLASVRHLTETGLEKLSRKAVEEVSAHADLEGMMGTAMFRGVEVPYQVRNGMAVFEGDILIGRVEELEMAGGKPKGQHRESVGITNTQYRWPGGVIPYVIDPALPNQTRVSSAVAHWNTKLGGTIQLVPRTSEAYYLRFTYTTSAGTCSSYVGSYKMANQPIYIGDNCSTGNVIHEIGHTVGLYHEHTREDRNTFVQIMWENIQTGYSHNFNQNITNSDDIGAYDYGSIMHYPAYGFSSNGNPTIVTIPAGIPIGQRNGLSAGDISGANSMYSGGTTPPPPSSTVTVSLGTNPTGRQLVVDGVTVTAPVNYSWTVGSVHSVSAPNTTLSNTRYLFSSWSDGGAQTHNVTTPTTALTLNASFITQYRLNSSSSNASLGTVSNSPTSADSFYNSNTNVSVTATPASSACFAGWSGVTAPPSTPLQITVGQPYDILGNFQTGAVSVSPTSVTIAAGGGATSVSVTTTTGCPWKATSNVNWITIHSGSGTGSGTVQFSVGRNNSKNPRTGSLTVGGVIVSVQQAGR